VTQFTIARNPKAKTLVRGIEIAYDDLGSGPSVVLLHGYPFNRSMWRDQLDELQQNHRVIIPDLRGHGESAVAQSPATMERMAGDVASLLEILNVSRAAIAGLSMGGYVSLAFYRLFPMRVRALVLADTRAQADTEEAKQNREKQAEKAEAVSPADLSMSELDKMVKELESDPVATVVAGPIRTTRKKAKVRLFTRAAMIPPRRHATTNLSSGPSKGPVPPAMVRVRPSRTAPHAKEGRSPTPSPARAAPTPRHETLARTFAGGPIAAVGWLGP